jgi:hypothetical protein
MKKLPLLVAVPMVIAITTSHAFAAGNNCQSLQASIEKQLEAAKSNESDNEVLGYQNVLQALKSQCDIAGLTKQTQARINKIQDQVAKVQGEAAAAETHLAEALSQNDEAKITQFEEIVGEKQQILMEQQDALEIAQAELEALTGNG